jgi:hypothetical protein
VQRTGRSVPIVFVQAVDPVGRRLRRELGTTFTQLKYTL